MMAFTFYAALIWMAAARWRRQWESFAWVAGGLAGLLLVAYLHWLLNVWTEGRIYLVVLRTLLYPYTVVVVAVGLFIACLPAARKKPAVPVCPGCAYDLHGLEDEVNSCPECGCPFMIENGRATKVWAEPISYGPGAAKSFTRARRGTQRRRAGPPPVVLRWPPV